MAKNPTETPESKRIKAAFERHKTAATGVTMASVAKALGLGPPQVQQWANGSRKVPHKHAQRVGAMIGEAPEAISELYRVNKTAEAGRPFVVGDSPAPPYADDSAIAVLQNDVIALRRAIASLIEATARHRPIEAGEVARSIRKRAPANFLAQGFLPGLLEVLDGAASRASGEAVPASAYPAARSARKGR